MMLLLLLASCCLFPPALAAGELLLVPSCRSRGVSWKNTRLPNSEDSPTGPRSKGPLMHTSGDGTCVLTERADECMGAGHGPWACMDFAQPVATAWSRTRMCLRVLRGDGETVTLMLDTSLPTRLRTSVCSLPRSPCWAERPRNPSWLSDAPKTSSSSSSCPSSSLYKDEVARALMVLQLHACVRGLRRANSTLPRIRAPRWIAPRRAPGWAPRPSPLRTVFVRVGNKCLAVRLPRLGAFGEDALAAVAASEGCSPDDGYLICGGKVIVPRAALPDHGGHTTCYYRYRGPAGGQTEAQKLAFDHPGEANATPVPAQAQATTRSGGGAPEHAQRTRSAAKKGSNAKPIKAKQKASKKRKKIQRVATKVVAVAVAAAVKPETTQSNRPVPTATTLRKQTRNKTTELSRLDPIMYPRGKHTALYVHLLKTSADASITTSTAQLSPKQKICRLSANLRWKKKTKPGATDVEVFSAAVINAQLLSDCGTGTASARRDSSDKAAYQGSYRHYCEGEMELWCEAMWPREQMNGHTPYALIRMAEYQELYNARKACARIPPRTLREYRGAWTLNGQVVLDRIGSPAQKIPDEIEHLLAVAVVLGVRRDDPLSAHDCQEYVRRYMTRADPKNNTKFLLQNVRTWFKGFRKRIYKKHGFNISAVRRVTHRSVARQCVLFVDMAIFELMVTNLLNTHPEINDLSQTGNWVWPCARLHVSICIVPSQRVG